jgi:DNA-binding MarR family transcriptional regulator
MNSESEEDVRKLRLAIVEARALLGDAAEQLRAILGEEVFRAETPVEVEAVMESAAEAIDEALHRLDSTAPTKRTSAAQPPGGPTRQQGQFLAFIREYMMRNQAGVAPSHADFQRFFDLTPPSVNSMLIRLEQRGFIRRIPGKARAIELIVNLDWIPPLDRPFRF